MGKSEASDVQCQVLTQLYLRIERGTRRNAGMNVGMWRVSGVHGKNAQLVLIISFASFQLSLSLSLFLGPWVSNPISRHMGSCVKLWQTHHFCQEVYVCMQEFKAPASGTHKQNKHELLKTDRTRVCSGTRGYPGVSMVVYREGLKCNFNSGPKCRTQIQSCV